MKQARRLVFGLFPACGDLPHQRVSVLGCNSEVGLKEKPPWKMCSWCMQLCLDPRKASTQMYSMGDLCFKCFALCVSPVQSISGELRQGCLRPHSF